MEIRHGVLLSVLAAFCCAAQSDTESSESVSNEAAGNTSEEFHLILCRSLSSHTPKTPDSPFAGLRIPQDISKSGSAGAGFQSADEQQIGLQQPQGWLDIGGDAFANLPEEGGGDVQRDSPGRSDAVRWMRGPGKKSPCAGTPIVRCELTLIACPACLIALNWTSKLESFRSSELHRPLACDPSKSDSEAYLSPFERDSAGDCAKLTISEPAAGHLRPPYASIHLSDHDSLILGSHTTTAGRVHISMELCANDAQLRRKLLKLFPIRVTVIENTEIIRGRPMVPASSLLPEVAKAKLRSSGIIESPRYPDSYPPTVVKNYTIINEDENGFVRLLFDDFQLNYMSSLKIYNSDNSLTFNSQGRFDGLNGRPAPFVSSGDRLTLVFAAGHYTHTVGFRARYTFVSGKFWPDEPSTGGGDSVSCDKVFESLGGAITIPSRNLDVNAHIDCVWIVRRARANKYNKLYVKVENFNVESDGAGIRLQIKDGVYSDAPDLLDIFGPKTDQQLALKQSEYGYTKRISDSASPWSDRPSHLNGYYIRLRGFLASYDGLSIAFAQYYSWATADCHTPDADFHCANGRCIAGALRCDRHDHCGDYSDERSVVGRPQCSGASGGAANGPHSNWNNGRVGGEYRGGSNTSHAAVPAGALAVVVSALVLIVLLLITVMIFVARLYRRRLLRRLGAGGHAAGRRVHDTAGGGAELAWADASSTLAAVGEPTSAAAYRAPPSIQTIGDRRFYVLPEADMSVLEAPPTYDDALKHPSVPPSSYVQLRSLGSSADAQRAVSDIPGPSGSGANAQPLDARARVSAPAAMHLDATGLSGAAVAEMAAPRQQATVGELPQPCAACDEDTSDMPPLEDQSSSDGESSAGAGCIIVAGAPTSSVGSTSDDDLDDDYYYEDDTEDAAATQPQQRGDKSAPGRRRRKSFVGRLSRWAIAKVAGGSGGATTAADVDDDPPAAAALSARAATPDERQQQEQPTTVRSASAAERRDSSQPVSADAAACESPRTVPPPVNSPSDSRPPSVGAQFPFRLESSV